MLPKLLCSLVILLSGFCPIWAVFLHNPRGTSNRCDEESNTSNNYQRLFNSNPDKFLAPSNTFPPTNTYVSAATGGYPWADQEMVFYEGTTLRIEWTSSSSCGNAESNKEDPTNPEELVCQEIIQLGCEPTFHMFAVGPFPSEFTNYSLSHGQSLGRLCADDVALTFNPECVTDPTNTQSAFTTFGDTCTQTRPLISQDCGGEITNNAACNTDLSPLGFNPTSVGTATFNSATCQCSTRKMVTYGYHEPENWYLRCRARQGNGGLFTADENPDREGGATNTRQEPNSARYGYECGEERDYYPYWYPTPWIDIAVLTSQTENCSYYQQQSQNVINKCACTTPLGDNASWYTCLTGGPVATCPEYYTTSTSCQNAGFIWDCYGSWNWAAPACQRAFSTTANQQGNINIVGETQNTSDNAGTLPYYNWEIPQGFVSTIYTSVNSYLSTLEGISTITPTDSLRCTLRIRSNVTSIDIPWNADYLSNRILSINPVRKYNSVLQNNSAFDVPLRFAVDTTLVGVTTQDRSYVFQIKQRSALPSTIPTNANIWNLNVRGRRGRLHEVGDALPYDFVPKILTVAPGDWVFFQWAGSDYNDQGNTGEGRDGLDRHNIVQLKSNNFESILPATVSAKSNSVFEPSDLLALAWIGQNPSQCYTTEQSTTSPGTTDAQNPMSCHYLNGPRQPGFPYIPTGYFGYLAQTNPNITGTTTFAYICSRNNAFGRQSQKGQIVVTTENLASPTSPPPCDEPSGLTCSQPYVAACVSPSFASSPTPTPAEAHSNALDLLPSGYIVNFVIMITLFFRFF